MPFRPQRGQTSTFPSRGTSKPRWSDVKSSTTMGASFSRSRHDLIVPPGVFREPPKISPRAKRLPRRPAITARPGYHERQPGVFHAVPADTVLDRRVHAARALLSLEARTRLAACRLRRLHL